MKFILAILLLLNPITFVAERNRKIKEGEQAFGQEDFGRVTGVYSYLADDLAFKNEGVYLNLAHGYFMQKNADRAAFFYDKLRESLNPIWQSLALNQLGYIACVDTGFERALVYFQQAIKAYPQNKEARYNYELIKKLLLKQGRPIASQKPQSDSTQNKQTQENGNRLQANTKKEANPNGKDETEQANEADNTQSENLQPQKLKDLDLNPEKAEAILNALKNQEAQYIQQLQRQRKSKHNLNSKKSDW
jgi:hypothetical protein